MEIQYTPYFMPLRKLSYYTVYSMKCHMRNSVTYPILRRVVGYTYDQQTS